MTRIAISIAGHTNNGKTTLARTLLRRDVGVVYDRPHVTDIADGHTLHKDSEAKIILWDLPGFGDSVRLKKRLMQSGIMAWLFSTFDRWKDRPLWCSQQCLKNAQNDADIILYLIDAGARPEDSTEVLAELEVLSLIHKPVILLLNQTGMPDAHRDQKMAHEWLSGLQHFSFIKEALPLDGWMRCWIQEGILFQKIAEQLPEEKQLAYGRLITEWKTIHHDQVLRDSMAAIAESLADTASDCAIVEKESIIDKAKTILSGKSSEQAAAAQEELVKMLIDRSRAMMDQLLKINQLEGTPKDRVDALVEGIKANHPNATPEVMAILAGVGSGLVSGLMADILAGGFTFGGGAVGGALLGGVTAYTLGRGYHKFTGKDGKARLRWSEDFLKNEWLAAGMRYLMVAHFGRGQGQWSDSESSTMPMRWQQLIEQWMKDNNSDIESALKNAQVERIQELLENMIQHVLNALYPSSTDKKAVTQIHDQTTNA